MQAITPDFLQVLSLRPDFSQGAAEVILVCGLEGAARLISAWGGQVWPVPIRIGGGNERGRDRWRRMVDVVGETAARCMVERWGGTPIDIPNLKIVKWRHDQGQIRKEFDVLTTKEGLSSPEAVFELGIKYNVAGRTIEKILKKS